ncbi:lantibiotic dehydratase [Streptomyces sp. NPDC021212]|uniref:lantibiotic dehydratase n=1 Tax=Streptomyces sp. NPDC021212 TaxID=3365118 RepID=UPI00379830ED
MLRAVHHTGVQLPAWPNTADATPTGVRAWCAWTREVWGIPEVADAIRHASPALGRDLDRLVANDTSPSAAAARRVLLPLIGYTLRLLHRPTPFGLFAGVNQGAFGERTHTRWGTGHRAVVRAEGAWLADLIQQMEEMADVRQRLRVVANNVLQIRGERLVLPWQPRRPDAVGTAVHEVSLRRTAAVRAAIQLTATPVPYQDVVRKLTAELPDLDTATTRALLDLLIARRMLLTSLQPPATEPDALGHVVAELHRSGADRTEHVRELADGLRQIHELMDTHNQLPLSAGGEHRSALTARMRQHGGHDSPLVIDIRLDAEVTLPRTVAWEAEAAAGLLARITPEPFGAQAWIRYRRAFRERYGDDVLVPLLGLLEELGLPEDFLGTPRAPWPATARRDAALLARAQQAIMDGREVELDDQLIEQLTLTQPAPRDVPAHLELSAEVHAPTGTAMNEGHFRLALRRVSRGWGHLTGGRFAALLAADDTPSGLLDTLARRPTTVEGALAVQLSFPALRHSATHITRTPRLAPLISIAEHREPDADTIALSDLAVLCHDGRLHLVSRSRRQVLEAASSHPLQIEFQTPTIARFLDELQRGQSSRMVTPYGGLEPWDWGAARHLPARPRVRYGRSILAQASWRLAHADLPGSEASTAQWEEAFTAWRERWRVPDTVYLEHFDSRLRLSLDQPAHLAVLRAQTLRPGNLPYLELIEAEPDSAFGWCHGRPTEIVTLLASAAPARPAPNLRAAPVFHRGGSHVPGASRYLAARLYGSSQARPALLSDHLPVLANDLGQPQWWITLPPDEEAGQYTALTIRLPHTADAADALGHLGRWADHLLDTGVLGDIEIVPHRPHLGRWGTGELQRAAEDVLAADCRALAHQIAHVRGIHPHVLTAANLIAIAAAFHHSAAAGLEWLTAQPKTPAAPPLPRDLLHRARAFAVPAAAWPALRKVPGGQALLEPHWEHRHAALAEYRTLLNNTAQGGSGAVLDALLHHHLSLADTEPGPRSTPWRLARAVALAATQDARPTQN